MKRKKLLATLGIVFALAVMTMPAAPVIAATINYNPHHITIYPEQGPVGTEVHVYGASFTPSVATIYFPDKTTLVKTVNNIDAAGGFDISFAISQYPAGEYTVWAFNDSATLSNWDGGWRLATFSLVPRIELSPSSGYVSSNVTVSGTGFAAASGITIYFDDSETAAATTDGNGSFTQQITVPESKNGSHDIKAVDTSANETTTTKFITKQNMSLLPASGTAGEQVTISGTGFAASEDVTITFNDNTVVTEPVAVKTSQKGGFTGKLAVPAFVADTYTVTASDGSNRAEASLAVETGSQINRIIGFVGSDVTFIGTGFTPNRVVIIYYDAIVITEVTADTNGSFMTSFKIPPCAGGEHTILTTDGIHTTERIFTVDTTAVSPAPVPVLPAANATISDPEIRFVWGEVTSPGGVTYNLQITSDITAFGSAPANTTAAPAETTPVSADTTATSANTTSVSAEAAAVSANATALILDRDNLTANEYVLSPEEKLKLTGAETTYFWRVRATGTAANIDAWSTIQTFHIGAAPPAVASNTDEVSAAAGDTSSGGTFLSSIPSWVRLSLIAEGAVFACLISFWLVKKRRSAKEKA